MALARIHTLHLVAWVGMAAACMGGKTEDTQGGGEGGETSTTGGSGPIGGGPVTGGAPGGGVTFGGSAGEAVATGGTMPGTGGSGWPMGGTMPATGGAGGGPMPGSGGTETGGTPTTESYYWPFDFNTQSWTASTFDPASVDPSVLWDDSTGNPNPGSLRLGIPFTAPNQKSQVSIVLAGPADYSQADVRVNVRLISGLTVDPWVGAGGAAGAAGSGATVPALPGAAKLFVRTGSDHILGESGGVLLDASVGWVTLTLDPSAPVNIEGDATAYDPTQVTEVGVEIDNGPDGAWGGTAVIYVDTVESSYSFP